MARPVRPAAWIHGSLGFGGGERVLIEQVRALAPRGNPVDVFTVGTPGPQDLVDAVRAANPHVRDVGRLDGSGDIAATLARRGYEAVFTCWSTRAYRGLERLPAVEHRDDGGARAVRDLFLVEGQMIASERYVRGPWRYARIDGANHWLQLDAPARVNPLLLEYLGLPRASLARGGAHGQGELPRDPGARLGEHAHRHHQGHGIRR